MCSNTKQLLHKCCKEITVYAKPLPVKGPLDILGQAYFTGIYDDSYINL